MTELETAIHRRLNLLNGEEMTTDELMAETKGMAAEVTAILNKKPTVLCYYGGVCNSISGMCYADCPKRKHAIANQY